MKIIAKDRGLDKTKRMIERSLETEYPIICANMGMKYFLKEQNAEVEVYSVSEYINNNMAGRFNHVIIDEVELCLRVIFGSNIDEASFTGDIEIERKETIAKKYNYTMRN